MAKFEEYYKVFNELGYHTNKKGAPYFFDLLDEIRELIAAGVEDEDILKAIPTICLEEYHFSLEIGGNLYRERINDFLTTKDEEKGHELISDINGISKDLNFEQAALVFAKYFDRKELERASGEESSKGIRH